MTEETIFEEALGKPPEQRASFLDQACAGQPELRAAVEALLAAHDKSGHILDQPPTGVVQTPDSDSGKSGTAATGHLTEEFDDASPQPMGTSHYHRDAAIGAVIADRYTLQEKIGEGGMGEVWVAKQTAPVKRKVALKLIKTGMDSQAVLRRFEHERQALALMDHPNIARVFDAGLTPTGQPFFVMELINGLPLDKFCDSARLTPKQRLELFVPICKAVQHAHQKGIVHRDLKPTNILVTMIDGRPTPKVIDFGVAKAISGKLIDESLTTNFGAVIGTLEYMSPEQAGFSNDDVDTRADVYALGVVLYELLTGLRPIDAVRLRGAALTEMVRILHEEEPSRPSTRLSTAAALPSLAAARQMEPSRLTALLRGELDWVVMKCLEKQRDRRYETPNALARDIERYLANEVVEARPQSMGYRLQKFARRNRGQLLAASLILLALVAGIIGTTWGLVEARRQATLARQEASDKEAARAAEAKRAEGERLAKLEADRRRLEAEQNLAFAKRGNEILATVFTQLDPQNPEQSFATIGELRSALGANLKQAADELEGSAIGDPLEVARMQAKLGLSLRRLGETQQAIEVLNKALKTLRSELGDEHLETLTTMTHLGATYHDALQMDASLALLEEAFRLKQKKFGQDHHETLVTMDNLALAYQDADRNEESLALLETALRLYQDTLGPDDQLTLVCLNNLALGYGRGGQLEKALPLFEEALERKRRALPKEDYSTIAAVMNLAGCYSSLKQLDKAVPLFEEGLARFRTKLGGEHRTTLQCMANLGCVYLEVKRVKDAVPLLEEAYKAAPVHPEFKTLCLPLLDAYVMTGQREPAVVLINKALVDVRAQLAPGSDQLALRLSSFGHKLVLLQAHAEAEPLLRESLAIGEKIQPFVWNSITQALLGGALLGQEKFAEAEPELLAAYTEMTKHDTKNIREAVMQTLQWLIKTYEGLEKPEEAAKWQKDLDAFKSGR